MASALFTSLASVADQYGQAKNAAQQEKQARADKLKSMDVNDAYLQLAKQADQRAQESHQQEIEKGNRLPVGNGQWWDVKQGKLIGPPQKNPFEDVKSYIASANKEDQVELARVAKMTAEGEPNNPKATIDAVMSRADKLQSERVRREDASQREKERREDNATREGERRTDKQESERANERLQKMMVDFRLQEKQQYMTPQERQVYDTIKQVEPSVQRTIDFLEQTKDSQGKALNEENNYVFGDRSALMQHLRMRGYKFGTKQEDITQQLIKNAALIQVLGARPWMTMGRGKFIYETIAQHLPSPTDTPANMYDKLTWLRDNVLADAKGSLAGYVQPGAAGGGGSGQGTQENPIVIP